MNSNQRNSAVLAGSVVLSSALSAAVIGSLGVHADALDSALRLTAQGALLIYLLVFVARPLRVLWPAALPRWLTRNRRYLGIAFAGVMTVHLALILWLKFGVTGEGIQPFTVLIGIVAYAFIAAMLVTSWDAPARALGARRWQRLHRAGLYWIGLPFLATILDAFRSGERPVVYAVLTGLMALAVLVRLAAWFRRRSRDAGHSKVPSA